MTVLSLEPSPAAGFAQHSSTSSSAVLKLGSLSQATLPLANLTLHYPQLPMRQLKGGEISLASPGSSSDPESGVHSACLPDSANSIATGSSDTGGPLGSSPISGRRFRCCPMEQRTGCKSASPAYPDRQFPVAREDVDPPEPHAAFAVCRFEIERFDGVAFIDNAADLERSPFTRCFLRFEMRSSFVPRSGYHHIG